MTAFSSDGKVIKLALQLPEYVRDYEVASGSTIYKGAMVCLNASGKAVPAADTAGLSRVIGIALCGASSSETVTVETGAYLVENDSLTHANIDDIVMVKDDATIKATSTNAIQAGIFRGIDLSTNKAMIEIGTMPSLPILSDAITDLTASATASDCATAINSILTILRASGYLPTT